MTIIEAIVALSILGLVGSGFAVGMNQTLLVTQDDRLRQQATHIAERELEIARNRFQHADENGQLGALTAGTLVNDEPLPGQPDGQPLRVDGHDFTVRRTQYLITNGNGTNPCDGGASVTYLSMGVTVVVSWLQNGQQRQVENRTILTPQKGIEGDRGYLAAKVTDAAGAPVNNVPVHATGPEAVQPVETVDGCAVFMLTTPGSYTLTLNEPGYVNFDGQQEVSKPATMQVGKLGVLPFSYDQAARLRVTFDTSVGHSVPESVPGVTVANSGLIGGERVTTGITPPIEVDGLWPFVDGYSVWAGTCDQSDPGLNALGYPRLTAELVEGGVTSNVSVPLRGVTLRAIDTSGQPVSGITLRAEPVDNSGCSGNDANLTLGTTGTDGVLDTSLPAGSWTVTPATSCPTITPTPGEDDPTCPAQTDEVVVVDESGNPDVGPAANTLDVVVSAP